MDHALPRTMLTVLIITNIKKQELNTITIPGRQHKLKKVRVDRGAGIGTLSWGAWCTLKSMGLEGVEAFTNHGVRRGCIFKEVSYQGLLRCLGMVSILPPEAPSHETVLTGEIIS